MAGYSKRTLVEKLGIKQGQRVVILGAPTDYAKTLGKLPPGVTLSASLRGENNFLHLFTKSRKELEEKFPVLKSHLAPTGCLWISWPKGSSGVASDLSENSVREIGLRNGLVDIKVCAVDEI
jgi:hypothetical protein